MNAANNSFNPMGDSQIQTLFSPSLADPFLEVMNNTNFFGGQIFNEGSPFGFSKPDSELGRDSTADIYKWGAKELNRLSGGDASESGFLDIHPESIRHMVEFPMGGTGQFFERAMENVEAMLSDKQEFDPNRLAIVRKFAATSQDFQDVNRYFRNKDQLEIIAERKDLLKDEGKKSKLGQERYKEFLNDNSKVISTRLINKLKVSESKIARWRKKRNMLQDRPDTENNRKMIKRMKDRILAEQINFNTKYNKVMLDKGFIRSLLDTEN
jgi:hypothetical protein